MKDLTEYFFLRLILGCVRLFPFPVVQRMGKAFGRFVYGVIGYRKTLVLDNLQHAFPQKSSDEIAAIAKGSYENLFTAFFEMMYMDKLSPEQIKKIISFPDARKIDEIRKRGKGIIILTGHFGNWELNALATPIFSPGKYTIIVQEQRNKYVNKFMLATRSRFGSRLVYMKNAFRQGLTALRQNEALALIADQSGPESGIYIDFFGRPASTHQGPAVFQLRSGAPIILVMFVREPGGGMRIDLEEIDTTNVTGTDEEKMKIITERHVKALERFVHRYPEQWLWMHKRWKHTEAYLQRQGAIQQ